MLRNTIFWIHLGCGVVTGLVVLMMSVTGVILTYERQMLAWADRAALSRAPAAESTERLTIEAIVAAVESQDPGFVPTAITIASDPAAPASVSAGRSGTRLIDPYTGASLGEADGGLRGFFGGVTGWHRWFNASGDERAVWRAVTGASNLAFLFLIVSGVYLWLPRVYKWAAFRAHLFFNPKALSGKARDFNWHHVFGIWSAIPLTVVVATAVVFSYSWANDLVYTALGELPPQRAGAPPLVRALAVSESPLVVSRPLDEFFEIAAQRVGGWRTITMQIPREQETQVRFTIDRGNGGQPQHRYTLALDAHTGQATAWEPFASQTPARRARSWVRFLHTGEALGLVGQTIAGVVSLTSIVMVWTGLALAYRRLIVPLIRRKPKR